MANADSTRIGGSWVKVERRNLSEAVADELLGWLRTGRYTVGHKLPAERELMETFGVGRNTVREAIQVLIALGAVDVRPGRGTTVLSTQPSAVLDSDVVAALLDSTTLDDLYEFRMTLESDVAFKAAQRAKPEDLEIAERALETYERAMKRGTAVYKADIDFHRALAVATHNAIYVKMSDALADLIVSARKATDQVPEAIRRAAKEHRQILDAVERGDAPSARSCMETHIASATWALQVARQQLAGAKGAPPSTASPKLRAPRLTSRQAKPA